MSTGLLLATWDTRRASRRLSSFSCCCPLLFLPAHTLCKLPAQSAYWRSYGFCLASSSGRGPPLWGLQKVLPPPFQQSLPALRLPPAEAIFSQPFPSPTAFPTGAAGGEEGPCRRWAVTPSRTPGAPAQGCPLPGAGGNGTAPPGRRRPAPVRGRGRGGRPARLALPSCGRWAPSPPSRRPRTGVNRPANGPFAPLVLGPRRDAGLRGGTRGSPAGRGAPRPFTLWPRQKKRCPRTLHGRRGGKIHRLLPRCF